jgi:hypothetical protein
MTQEKEGICKRDLITILVCTGISIILLNTGFLFPVFLAPIGYAVIVTGSFWFTFCVAAASNIISSLILSNSGANSTILLGFFYFTTLLLCYVWIIGGNNTRTAYRFILSSAAGAVVFLIVLNRLESVFTITFNQFVEDLPLNINSSDFLETVNNILLRGGALVSMCFLFFVNRQITHSAVWIIKKQRNHRPLSEFFAPPNTIWILTGALVTIILTRLFNIELFEIIAWNVFTICAIIFLAQGAGILLFLISRCSATLRLIIFTVIIFLLFSPLSAIAVIAVLLLGIVENWVSFRVGKSTQ